MVEHEKRSRILIAADPESAGRVRQVMGAVHQYVEANKIEEAVSILSGRKFDLILLGVHFDESRMFELLPKARLGRNSKTPIICVCTRDTQMTRAMHESIEVTCKAFGVWMYIDQHKYNVTQDPDAEMRRVIERCLIHDARKAALGERIDIQQRRGELLELRQVLESEVWSPELETQLGGLRRQLAQQMLLLSELRIENLDHQVSIAESEEKVDRVSDSVHEAENLMDSQEIDQERSEFAQTRTEHGQVELEEVKGALGRRDHSEGDQPQP
jgi:CheY-like chemotaxis protein